MTDKTSNKTNPDAGERQSDATTERNKPDEARAKGAPKAGNILGSVQPEKK